MNRRNCEAWPSYLESPIEQLEWADTRHLAKVIIDQLGDDHGNNDSELWETAWTDDRLQKCFNLSQEPAEDGPVYYLDVTSSVEPSPTVRYGFDEMYYSISLYLGDQDDSEDDLEEIEYFADDNPMVCRGIEQLLKRYLRSAPIDILDVAVDKGWSELFDKMVRKMSVREQPILAAKTTKVLSAEERFLKTYSERGIQECESVADYIQYTLRISRPDAYDVIGYRPPWYKESVDHGEA